MVRNPPANAGDLGSTPGLERSPGEMKSQPTSVYLPGKSCGQRSLAGHSPRGRRESHTTERTWHVGTKDKTKLFNYSSERRQRKHAFLFFASLL